MFGSISGMGSMQGMGMGGFRAQSLTSDQKSKLQDILSNYDASNVTSDDAKAMFKAFEEAGIKGPGLRDAIQSSGFDADQVWSLAHDGQKPPQGGPPQGGMQGSAKLNTSALQSLQDILSQYDLTNLTSDQQDDLMTKLSKAGLMNTGSLIDTGV
jgi:hypothetical protein